MTVETDQEIIDGEVVDTTTGEILPAVRPDAPVNLFHSDDPAEVIAKATAHATALADVVRQKNLVAKIGNGEHVQVEGWTLLGSMLGVFPVAVWTHKLDNGWEARVEARTMDGRTVGAAEAMCTRDERTWKSRDDYALRSMAQTRATSKALRMPLGFIMQLAGFNPTPAEEVSESGSRGRSERPPPATATPDAVCTEAQTKMIHALLTRRKDGDRWVEREPDDVIADMEYRELLAAKYGVDSSKSLTKKQASELIEALSDEGGKRAAAIGWVRARLAQEAAIND